MTDQTAKLDVNTVINQLLTPKSKDTFPKLAQATKEVQKLRPQVVEKQKIVSTLTRQLRITTDELLELKQKQKDALLAQANAYMNEFVYVLLKKGPKK